MSDLWWGHPPLGHTSWGCSIEMLFSLPGSISQDEHDTTCFSGAERVEKSLLVFGSPPPYPPPSIKGEDVSKGQTLWTDTTCFRGGGPWETCRADK